MVEPPRRGGSNEYLQSICFEQKCEKYQSFLFENFQFLEMKLSLYLKRRVFVMRISASFTDASNSYLAHSYPSRGKDKNREFSRFWLCRKSRYAIFKADVTKRHGIVITIWWMSAIGEMHYQKNTFKNERYARKRIYHGYEGKNPSLGKPRDVRHP